MVYITCHQGNTNSKQWDTTNTPIRMVKIQNMYWQHQMLERMWSNWNSHSLPVGIQIWKFLTKLLPYDPAIILPGTYPKEVKPYIHIKACTWMFIGALFVIAKTWKQATRCPSVSKQIIGTIFRQQNIIQYWKKKLSSHEKTWRNFMTPTIWYSGKGKTMETIKGQWLPRGKGEVGMNSWNTGFLGQWTHSVWYYNGGFVSLCICQDPQNIKQQEWTLRQTAGLGWCWCVNVVPSL